MPRVCKNSEDCRQLCGIWLNETVLLHREFKLGFLMAGEPTRLSSRVSQHRALLFRLNNRMQPINGP